MLPRLHLLQATGPMSMQRACAACYKVVIRGVWAYKSDTCLFFEIFGSYLAALGGLELAI